MKMYSVEKISAGEYDGTLSFPETLGIRHLFHDARELMNSDYYKELEQRGLEDNGASSATGDAIPGGFLLNGEGYILDTWDKRNLDEEPHTVVSYSINPVEVELPDAKEAALNHSDNCLVLPTGELGTLKPGGAVYVIDDVRSLNAAGRAFRKNQKWVTQGDIISVKYETPGEFWVEVRVTTYLGDVFDQHKYAYIDTFKYGKNAFLDKTLAEQALNEKA